MTSRTGAPINNDGRARRRGAAGVAFTLVELILVMALMVTLLAVAVPSLSRSMRARNLDQEAERLLALTGYARDEAVSQGIPMALWIDVDGRRFGVDAKPGNHPDGDNARAKEYALDAGLHFEPVGGGMVSALASGATTGGSGNGSGAAANPASGNVHGGVVVAVFSPEGTLDPLSVASVRVGDRAGALLGIAQTPDGYGYEIVKEGGQ